MKTRLLIVDDEISTRFGFKRYFLKEGYESVEAGDLAEARVALSEQRFDAIILDLNLPDGNGLDYVSEIKTEYPDIPIILITGDGDIPVAVEAMRRGADNFLTKPVNMESLSIFLTKTLEVGALKREQISRKRLEKKEDFFSSESGKMKEVVEMSRIAAESDSPVLITGETGTGKGMIAKWIHRNSKRSANTFVEVNCGGLRGELLSREIFGNVRGAFTSADQDRKGLLDVADRGTFFLDEVSEMGSDIQSHFLKVLEDKSYRRLGDVKLLKSDFRLICATNRDIDELISDGAFRQDLLYRINLITIHIPPLRERIEDMPLLTRHLMKALGMEESNIVPEVMEKLKAYAWPGNIRELKNILERAMLLSRGRTLMPEHFDSLRNRNIDVQGDQNVSFKVGRTIEEVERACMLDAMKECNGNINSAAKKLGISRATLYRKLKDLPK